MATTKSINVQAVRDKVAYDPGTGFVYCKKTGRRYTATCGRPGKKYGVVSFGGVRLLVHRIAFIAMIGRHPERDIDHINGDTLDNRWGNLREVSRRINVQNSKRVRDGKVLGATFNQNRWESRMSINGRTVYLGRFKTAQEAADAYAAKALELGEFAPPLTSP